MSSLTRLRPAGSTIRDHARRLLLESVVVIFFEVGEQFVIAFEVFAESQIVAGILAVLRAVFLADVGTGFVNGAFIVRS